MKELKVFNSYLGYVFEERNKQETIGLSKQEIERGQVLKYLYAKFPTAQLSRLPIGQPVISGTAFSNISIAHSKGWYALYLSNEKVGIDIQYKGSNLSPGKHYFINKQEDRVSWSETELYLIWGAKEAVFKKYGGLIEDLKNEVTTDEICLQENMMNLRYRNQIERVRFLLEENMVLVWTIPSGEMHAF